MPSRNGRVDLTLLGISDTELLGIIEDVQGPDGWTQTSDVRLQLGESLEVKHSGVGSRLAWMRRYGWLEQSHERRDLHRLSAAGQALLSNPKLTKAIASALDSLNPAQRLVVTREIAENAAENRIALRRQWTRSLR
jgi:hypothetical protein